MAKRKRVEKKISRFLRTKREDLRAKILSSKILSRSRVPYDEIYLGGSNYLCGYARTPTRIRGKVVSFCALGSFGGKKTCEVQPPMGPPERCDNYRLFQIQNRARPTGMYSFKDCEDYLRVYFPWGAHIISSQAYFSKGADGGRLREIVINGLIKNLELDEQGIKEALSQIPYTARNSIKRYLWRKGKDFWEEVDMAVPDGNYVRNGNGNSLKGKVRYNHSNI
ncbi:MAG: hypothetical protein WC494_02655 [Candidatus Pacearchaeota archaeon]